MRWGTLINYDGSHLLSCSTFFFPSGIIKPVFFFRRRCTWLSEITSYNFELYICPFFVISLDQFQRKNHNITDTFRPDPFVICLSLCATHRCYIQWSDIQYAVRLFCLDKNVRAYTRNLAVWNWECLVSWGEISSSSSSVHFSTFVWSLYLPLTPCPLTPILLVSTFAITLLGAVSLTSLITWGVFGLWSQHSVLLWNRIYFTRSSTFEK